MVENLHFYFEHPVHPESVINFAVGEFLDLSPNSTSRKFSFDLGFGKLTVLVLGNPVSKFSK